MSAVDGSRRMSDQQARWLLLAAQGQWGEVPPAEWPAMADRLEQALGAPRIEPIEPKERLGDVAQILVTDTAAQRAARDWALGVEDARKRLTIALIRATPCLPEGRQYRPGELQTWRVRKPWNVTARVSLEHPLAIVTALGEVRPASKRRKQDWAAPFASRPSRGKP